MALQPVFMIEMEFPDEFSISEIMDFAFPEQSSPSQLVLSSPRNVSYHRFLAAGRDNNPSKEKDNRVAAHDVSGEVEGDRRVPVPRPALWLLAERLVHAMSLLKGSDVAGILSQVWVPVRQGNTYILTTCDQPYYMMESILAGYREVSRRYNFAGENLPGSFLGLPGRVFTSKVPEWTSDVSYYNRTEFARVNHAAEFQVRGSLAVPIFDPHDQSCCAVLELATSATKINFDDEIDFISQATEAVNLETITSHVHHGVQILSKSEVAAFSEINDVLKVICPAFNLPLALTWILCPSANNISSHAMSIKNLLCIQESACYLNDQQMEGFFRVCMGHHLQKGQGIAGKALQLEHASFCANVKNYHIQDYPLVHHARKFGLNAAVAIRLRSTYTEDRDYILELFLPTSCVATHHQQLLLNSISNRMQKLCRSLKTTAKAKLGLDACVSHVHDELSHKQLHLETVEASFDSTKKLDRKKNTLEKSVSYNTLTTYFSGSLKDAAKNLGVCPTTLKKICRGHGISKWPYRKLEKVNRSLKNIQVDMDSVKEVNAALNYDPQRYSLFTTTTAIPRSETQSGKYSTQNEIENVERESLVSTQNEMENIDFKSLAFTQRKLNHDKKCVEDGQWFSGLIVESTPIYLYEDITCGLPVSKNEVENRYTSSNSVIGLGDNANSRPGYESEFVETYNPSLSSMVSSSCGNCSSCASSSITLSLNNRSEIEKSIGSSEFAFSVKASYKEALVRFKFIPTTGYYHLYNEIGKKFGLASGSYQLNYIDDEKEWILLVSQTDLDECININVSSGCCLIKLMVRELPSSDHGNSSNQGGFFVEW